MAEEFTVRQQKTDVGTVVALSSHAQKALEDWIEHAHKLPEDFLFTRVKGETGKPITRDLLARALAARQQGAMTSGRMLASAAL